MHTVENKRPLRSPLELSHLDGKVTQKELRLIQKIFGIEGLRFWFQATQGRHVPALTLSDTHLSPEVKQTKATINESLLQWCQGEYGIEPTAQAEYIQQVLGIVELTHRYFVNTLFPEQYALFSGLHNSAVMAADPLLVLKQLSVLSDPVLQHETVLKLMMADTVSRLKIWEAQASPHRLLSKVQEVCEWLLFEGKNGATELKNLYSIHDRENKVVAWAENQKELESMLESGQHLKRMTLRTRRVKTGDISVMMDVRTKPIESQVSKAFLRALTNDGAIKYERVSDIIGVQFLVVGDVAEREQFEDLFMRAIAVGTEQGVFVQVRMEDDDTADGAASPKSHKMRRVQIHMNGKSIPLEVIFMTVPEYLNAKYNVGTFDEEKGFWSGNAHALFTIYRLYQLIDYIFPERLYSFDPALTPRSCALAHTEKVIAQLRADRAVDLGA